MSPVLGLCNFLLLTASLFAGLTAMAVALLYPRVRHRLARLAPRTHARILYLLCVAPIFLGALYTALCFLPGALGTVWSSLDHCLEHGGHAHLCLIHLPGTAGTVAGWSLGSLALAYFLMPFGHQLKRARRLRHSLDQLLRSASRDGALDVSLIDSDMPFAAATLHTSQILLSTALTDRLSSAHLQVVLEHERAHLRRRDPLFRLIAALLASAHVGSLRRLLLDDLELASERACDEEAAARVGNRVHVAETLLVVERLLHNARPPLTGHVAFAGPHIVHRVEALLAPPVENPARGRERLWMLACFSLSLAMTDPLHHAAETLVTFIGA